MHGEVGEVGLGRWGPSPIEGRAVALFLHGRARSPEDVLKLATRLELTGLACLAPAAPGGTWYPESFMAPVEKNQPYLDRALGRMDALVRVLEVMGHTRERIALVGFSQGACLAAEFVKRNPRRWGALIAFTGGLIGPPGMELASTGDLAGTPVLLASAQPDQWVPVERVKESAVVFRAMNGAVTERFYPGLEHAVNDEEIGLARELLAPLVNAEAKAR